MGFTGRETVVRCLCLLVGEPGMEGPVPGTPEFMQMLSDYESATKAMAAAGVLPPRAGGQLQRPVHPPGPGHLRGRHRRRAHRVAARGLRERGVTCQTDMLASVPRAVIGH
jgi:hypothetical protein